MSVRILGWSLEFKNYALNPAAHPNLAQNLESRSLPFCTPCTLHLAYLNKNRILHQS
ncbi:MULTISPECIES: hypothetical protein [Helicobacter]|uniref:hypothetical protein n=1 Tax=Helicobacter TaxID=209 RepID=UPI0012BBC2A9|nr:MULTISPECIES: hypothetical protein [Helicobacter]